MATETTTGAGLRAALEELPLFPLPQVALFPGATMPLHVFEPRYLALVRDALTTHRTIAVVQLMAAESADAQGLPAIASIAGVGTIVDHMEMPAIASIAGLGTIVDHMEMPGGRYNILLKGVAVVRLEELPFVPPYRRARATIVPDLDEHVDPAELTALLSSAASFARVVREREPGFELRLPKDVSAGLTADLCAAQLLLDGADRQRVLEERRVSARVQLVTERIVLQQVALRPPGKDLN